MLSINVMAYCYVMLILEVLTQSPLSSIYDKFHQTDFKIKFEHVDVDHYNKSVFKVLKIVTFKHNRTCTAINASMELRIDINNEMELVIQTYKFASNEYRLFPLRYQVNSCLALSNNLVGIAGYRKCGNFSGCPLKKEISMHFCNWSPDESKYPPFIPTGRYLTDVQMIYRSTEVALLKTYEEVYRPIPIPN